MKAASTPAMERWFCGDKQAIEFAAILWDAMQKWDDVIDEGTTVHANTVLQWMAFRMAWHPFFAQYERMLRPALLQMYLDWRDATTIEKSGEPADLEKAFVLRAGIYRVYALMAWIIGDEAHSQAVGPEIHRAYAERLADYIEEHSHA